MRFARNNSLNYRRALLYRISGVIEKKYPQAVSIHSNRAISREEYHLSVIESALDGNREANHAIPVLWESFSPILRAYYLLSNDLRL